AKLAHQENLAPAVALALQRAGVAPDQLSAVAVTIGPGLAPALEVGLKFAQQFCEQHQLPLIPANHLEGHVCSVLAQPKKRSETANTRSATVAPPPTDSKLKLPVLAIVVSGRNTLFVTVEKNVIGTTDAEVSRQNLERQPRLGLDTSTADTPWKPAFTYTVLGRTLDDAAGECLDKVGRMLNLGYPAGPVVEIFAKQGDPKRYSFPLPLTQTKTFDLSYSGIKTHSRNLLTELGGIEALTKQDIYDFCASLQYAVFRHINYKLEKVLQESGQLYHEVWLSGGAAANIALRSSIRQTLRAYAKQQSLPTLILRTPYSKKLCGDNAAMIGIVPFPSHH
ncbi:hypothetical protein KA012_03265, partial [Candidatus Woesebacteria bacterium]|nr:hypothetical protein [Candidatus Woesebacteria bacterium]